MKVTLVSGRDLSESDVRAWLDLQQQNPGLESPYFRPEFTRIIAEARSDVEVAVLTDGDKVVAFFPFQRERARIGKSVGHPLSDYHGIISAAGANFDLLSILRACGLVGWDFDHVPWSNDSLRAFMQLREISPTINFSMPFERYLADRRSCGSDLRKPLQLMRKLEREFGPIVLKPHVDDIRVLRFIMERKSEQYRNTGVPDLFSKEWIRLAVERVFQTQTKDFGGMLSALYAGPEMVAALLSIRSSDIIHAWFLAFDERFSSYSPGLLLYLKFAEIGQQLGFRYLDIGKGDHVHKRRLMNGFVAVGTGAVELPLGHATRLAARTIRNSARNVIAYSPLAEPARRWVRARRLQRL